MKPFFELLAPAGSFEGFEAALGAGADAVYVGGSSFGARAYAKNFTEEELLRAIDTAHIHDRKLYLTVNTLMKNRELKEQLYDYLLPYYEAGLDAVIVQDLGVFQFIREHFPGLHLHASTQMTVTGPKGMRFLEEKGASRVVTARELSLEELTRMHQASTIEIEAFIHGALCYSFSGQCLMSSILGGRSGNRGRCAQPCRLPYQAIIKERIVQSGRTRKNGQAKQPNHKNDSVKPEFCPLSMRDMSTIEILPEILEAGVYSLKIEGRMKQPQYTAGVTEIYRKYLDHYQQYGAQEYRVEEADRRRLLDIFSRGGSCEGYYRQQNGPEMMAFSNEKKTGNITVEIRKAKTGLQGELVLIPGEPVRLSVTCRDASVQVEAGEVQKADKNPMEEARIRQQMEKLGNTDFSWEKLKIRTEDEIFVPVKILNECRREAIAKIAEELTKKKYARRLPEFQQQQTVEQYQSAARHQTTAHHKTIGQNQTSGQNQSADHPAPSFYVSCETKEQARSVWDKPGLTGLYVNFDTMKTCMESGLASQKELYLSLPHIVREDLPEGYLQQAENWLAEGMRGFLVRNMEGFAALKEAGLSRYCVIDHSLYTWNDEALRFWEQEGILRNTVPLELSEKELAHRENRDSELLLYGYLPMMISAQCVQKNLSGCDQKENTLRLQDRYHTVFPVACHCDPWKTKTTRKGKNCYNIIYNSVPYGLIRDRKQMEKLGMKAYRIAFTLESPGECGRLLEEFLDVYLSDGAPREHTFTRGHFKRGAE